MAKTNKAIKISKKHLLGIQDLSINDINLILKEAKNFISLYLSYFGPKSIVCAFFSLKTLFLVHFF